MQEKRNDKSNKKQQNDGVDLCRKMCVKKCYIILFTYWKVTQKLISIKDVDGNPPYSADIFFDKQQ